MSLQIRYNRISTPAGTEPDTITARAGVKFSSNAEEGSVGMSQIVVDDTGNTLDYVGLRRVYAFETAALAHNQIIFNGYLQKRTIGRRPAEGQDDDEEVMGRRWVLDIADTNSLLSRRLITGADGERPAETDVARIQWLLDSNDAYLSNPQDTWENPSPYVNTVGPIDMSAEDYRGRTAFDVLNDCAQRSGKNWFGFYYEANDTVPPTNGGSIALWYDLATSTAYSSTLRLTNVRSEADNVTTFAVLPDAVLSRDPVRTYSGIYLTYDGGELYQQSTNVVNLFQRRDAAVTNPHVKTNAEAVALATRYLADAESEDDRIDCEFIVDKQYVNDLREGQRFEGKLSHLPDYGTAYSWWRCLRRTVTHINDEQYRIAIEATPSPTAGGIIQSASNRTTTVVDNIITFSQPTVSGSLLLAWTSRRSGTVGLQTGWTYLGNGVNPSGYGGEGRWQYRFATGATSYSFERDKGFSNTLITVYELSGYDDFVVGDATLYETDEGASSTTLALSSVTSPQAVQTILAGWTYDTGFNPNQNATMGAGMVKDYNDGLTDAFADQHPWHLAAHWNGTTTPLTPSATIPATAPYCGVIVQLT